MPSTRRNSIRRNLLTAISLPALWLVAWTHPAWGPHVPSACMMKRTTGLPCALCGGTRAAAALARGEPLRAFAMNPLAALIVLAAAAEWTRRIARAVGAGASSESKAGAEAAEGREPDDGASATAAPFDPIVRAWRNHSGFRVAVVAGGFAMLLANWAYVLSRGR